jgi:O-antigen/teichoic acid export membrane protein
VNEDLSGGPVESPARTVFRHSLMTLGTRVGTVLVNIPTSILVARLLGAAGQGEYASAVIFPTTFAFIGLLGVDSAHTYFLSRRNYTLGQVNSQSALLTIAFSAVLVPGYLLFVHLYNGVETEAFRSILVIAAALVPILIAKYLSIALLLGLQRIRWFNAANLLQAAALLVLMLVNLLVVKGGVKGAVVAYMVSEATVTLLAFHVARRASRGRPLFERPTRELLKRSFIYGLQGHMGNVLIQFTYRFDMFLVLSFAGLPAQGLYSIAVILAEKLSHIPQSVQVVLFPKLSTLEADDANRLTPRVLRSSLAMTAVAGVVLLLLSRPLLSLFYGSEYAGSLVPFRALVPGIVALSIARILSSDLSGRDKRIYHTASTAAAFGLNVVLCLLWIPRYGIVGAAWASTISYTLQSIVMLVFFRRLSGVGFREALVPGREDVRLMADFLKGLLRRRR